MTIVGYGWILSNTRRTCPAPGVSTFQNSRSILRTLENAVRSRADLLVGGGPPGPTAQVTETASKQQDNSYSRFAVIGDSPRDSPDFSGAVGHCPTGLFGTTRRPTRWIIIGAGLVMAYKVVVRRTEEGYSVNCPGLPGCWSQGETEQEALANIQDAIGEYLEVRERLDWTAREGVV